MAGLRNFPKILLLLLLLVPAMRHAQAQPAQHPAVGANDLFAALAAPDHEQLVEHLRAIKAMLADGADPRAVNAARGQLDALLNTPSAAAAEQPPAIVMSALAARIDGAIGRLERAGLNPQANDPDQSGPGSLAWGLLCALAVGEALLLLACMLGLRHSLAGTARVPAMLARLDELAPRIGAVLARPSAEQQASREAEAAFLAMLAELRETAGQTQNVLRHAAEHGEAELARAETLLGQAERVANALPALMGEAVSSLEARGLPALEAAAARCEELAQARLPAEPAEPAWLTLAQQRQEAFVEAQLAPLAASLEALLASSEGEPAPSLPPALSEGLADLEAHIIAAQTASEARVLAALAPTKLLAGVETLPSAVAGLAGMLAPIELAAREASALLESIDARVGNSLAGLPQAASALSRAVQTLRSEGAEERLMLTDMLEQQRGAVEARFDALAGQLTACTEQTAQAAALPGQMIEALPATLSTTLAQALAPCEQRIAASLSRLAPEIAPHLAEAIGAQLSALGLAGLSQSLAAQFCALDCAVEGASARMEAGLADFTASQQRQSAALMQWQQLHGRSLSTALEQLAARADAALSSLPVEAELICRMLTGLTQESAALRAGQEAGLAMVHTSLAGFLEQAAPLLVASTAQSDWQEAMIHRLDAQTRELAGLPMALACGPAIERAAVDLGGQMAGGFAGLRAELAATLHAVPAPGAERVLAALGRLTEAMMRLAGRTEQQERGLTRLIEASEELRASLQARGPAAPDLAEIPDICRRIALSCEGLAEAALRGDRSRLPANLPTQLPMLLAGIDASIHRLRGCATALALASDLQAA